METGENNSTSSSNQSCAVMKDSKWYTQFRNVSNPWMARYVYGLIFLVANLLAWAARDELSSLSALTEMKGQIAHFGAGVFLLIQLISIISFINWLTDCFGSEKYAERCQIQVMLFATISYFICLVGIILMYIWYAPQPSCLLNIFFITWTLVLLQLMTSVSLHPKVNAGILSPGLMGLYVVFLCWCAIRSEPEGAECIRKSESANKTDWQSIISFVVAILALVVATFSTGIDSKCFQVLQCISNKSLQFRKSDPPAEDDVPYGYGFFHFVFATGAMYFAMLLIGWNSHHSMRKWTIDVGWTSAWVRIVNEWLAVCVYCKGPWLVEIEVAFAFEIRRDWISDNQQMVGGVEREKEEMRQYSAHNASLGVNAWASPPAGCSLNDTVIE
ncbi:hypothetical protein JHK82_025562 [Glycine max]|nr:hypothetical protein JHK82_025562 [Glycine max]